MPAHHLAYLQIDLTDPDYPQHMRVQAADTRRELRRLLADAVAAGELVAETAVDVLTRAVQAALNGSLFVWAMLREARPPSPLAPMWMRCWRPTSRG